MKMPEALVRAAGTADARMESAMLTEIPTPRRPYSAKVLKSLVDAAAKASMLFGAPVEIEIKDPSRLPGELVRTLAMIEQAAADYGNPFPVSIREAQTDDAMVAIAAHLLNLVKDQDFKDFLEAEPVEDAPLPEGPEGEEPDAPAEREEEEVTPYGERVEQEDDGEVEDEDREMFRRRMSF